MSRGTYCPASGERGTWEWWTQRHRQRFFDALYRLELISMAEYFNAMDGMEGTHAI